MAKESERSLKRASLKNKLLLGFVAASVLMIGAIWVQNMVDPDPETPSYYRESYQVDDSIYLTVTADALKYNPEPVGTPEPAGEAEHERGSGQGPGQGQGSGQNSRSEEADN